MALIPGSYARAAGLQSEINKVTVTRVAGSEVQFRRTIDTYQRDLRYNVNQIGREQRLLRRSLRRYSKKLRDSRKDRQQRQAKAKGQSEKQEQITKQFPKAEEILEHSAPLVSNASDKSSPAENNPFDVPRTSDSNHVSDAGQHQGMMPTLADSPDSGVGSETEDTTSPESTDTAQRHDPSEKTKPRPAQNAFLTSSKGKLPYLKAKRGHANNKQDDKHAHRLRQSNSLDHLIVPTLLSDNEELLPIIAEENEEPAENLTCSKSIPDEPADQLQTQADDCPAAPDNGDGSSHVTSTDRAQPPVVTSLDTKSLSQPGKTYTGKGPSLSAHDSKDSKADHDDDSTNAEDTVSAIRRQRPRRKTGVSYGDLIKLQHSHTSSSKQLFKLVDRLASVHGIVDTAPFPSSSTPSSRDPRTNVKMKRRLKTSRTPDGIVKQAAVLYSMKYGYNLPDSQAEDVTATSEPPEVSSDTKDDQEGTAGYRHARRSVIRAPGVMSDPAQQSTLSVRRDSTDVTSPFYEFSEAASSIFDDLIFESVSASPRRNKSKPLTLTELSVQATKIRERTLHGPQVSQERSEDADSNKVVSRNDRKLNSDKAQKDSAVEEHRARRRSRVASPVSRRSRSLSRRRRDSVEEQLQRRLNDEGEVGKMAWHSAFGRLKMIHTLYDLSQHFSK